MAFSSVPDECSYSVNVNSFPVPLEIYALQHSAPPRDAFSSYAQFRALLFRFAATGVLW